MNTRVLNRLNGTVTDLPAFSVAGLLAGATGGLLNGLPASPGTLLLPDVRGLLTWQVLPLESSTVRFPDPGDALELGSLDAALTGLALQDGDWDDWLRTSPLDRDLAAELQRLPLEEAMHLELAHLESVCRQPRTHLEIVEERQLVSRARQIPVRAVNYLASHTEDWDARTLRGVRPRRVITNVRDDRYDIYENRVAVRLVDHLSTYVRRRLSRIQELLRSLQTIDVNAQEPPSGMHWRQQRIYRLWGEALDLTEAQLLASERIDELSLFLYRLERLRGSLLYTQVPTKSQVAAQLRITNILGNDPHYRRVARLWMSWYRHAHTGHPSLTEQQRTAQHEAAQFDRYALLLTLHALEQFDFTPGPDRRIRQGLALPLRGPEGAVSVTWNTDGTTSLHRQGVEVLRIVASPTRLTDLGRDDVARVIAHLTSEAGALTCQTVLLYPGAAGRTPVIALNAVSGDPGRLHPLLSCLPVSTVDLESVERLARAMRWVLTGDRLRAYPPTVASVVPVPRDDRPTALVERRSGLWEVLSPMDSRPQSWAHETKRRQGARDDAARQLAAIGAEGLPRRQAQRKVDQLQAEVDEWQAFLGAVEAGQAAISQLRRCPVCGTEDASFSGWQGGQFRCECGDCGAQWSLRQCRECAQYHPWLLPRLKEVPTITVTPGWADLLYGRDVLTLPDPHELDAFGCPEARARLV